MATVKEPTNFTVYDLEGATNIMREIVAIEKEQAELDMVLEKTVAWHKEESGKLASDREWRESQLCHYHETILVENPSKKTISTPWGKIEAKTYQATPSKPDVDVLVAILETTGQTNYLSKETVVKANWQDYKKSLTVVGDKVVDSNGEVVTDIEVKPENTTFKVEITHE